MQPAPDEAASTVDWIRGFPEVLSNPKHSATNSGESCSGTEWALVNEQLHHASLVLYVLILLSSSSSYHYYSPFLFCLSELPLTQRTNVNFISSDGRPSPPAGCGKREGGRL